MSKGTNDHKKGVGKGSGKGGATQPSYSPGPVHPKGPRKSHMKGC